ncbi:MazG family protein [Lachnospiraceae bacterium 62-35]
MHTFDDLIDVVAKLRDEKGGCPWDREQTFDSLKQYLLNESQEVIEAVDKHDMNNLCEELGDVLFHVVFYSQLGREKGIFSIEDVIDGICRKMIYRHPHVFGGLKIDSVKECNDLWKELKKREKGKKP